MSALKIEVKLSDFCDSPSQRCWWLEEGDSTGGGEK